MASELKPCPFCGSNQLSFRSTPDMDTDGKYHRISCNECGASSRATFAMDACPLFFEELRNVWNTRPAPAATDTGLKTIGFVPPMFVEGKGADYNDIFRSVSIAENYTAVVTRSQAEKLLAAKDYLLSVSDTVAQQLQNQIVTLTLQKEDLEADNAAKDARIKELEAALDSDPDGSGLWRFWSKKSIEANQQLRDKTKTIKALEAKLAAYEKSGVRHD